MNKALQQIAWQSLNYSFFYLFNFVWVIYKGLVYKDDTAEYV